VLGVIYAFMKSGGSDKIAPMLSRGGVSPITKQASGWCVPCPEKVNPQPLNLFYARRKTQVKAVDESEGLNPEALEQMKKELKLLQGKVVANIEKELKAASDKGKEERGAAFAEANELIACINADAMRLHGDSAKVIGGAAKLGPGLLVDAAKEGDTKIVRELLATGADVNHTKEGDEGRTALYKAAWKGHLEAVQALIDAGADVDKGGTTDWATPLLMAVENNHTQVAQALIDAGADVDKGTTTNERTPLLVAAQNNHIQVAQALIDAGADVDKGGTTTGCTPLTNAAYNGHLEIVKALVGANADVNKADNYRGTPLRNATMREHRSVAAYLKSVGAKDAQELQQMGGSMIDAAEKGDAKMEALTQSTPQHVVVQMPLGAVTGSAMVLQGPYGPFSVVIPSGVEPGQQFGVMVPQPVMIPAPVPAVTGGEFGCEQ
jgi:hypothetical protein